VSRVCANIGRLKSRINRQRRCVFIIIEISDLKKRSPKIGFLKKREAIIA